MDIRTQDIANQLAETRHYMDLLEQRLTTARERRDLLIRSLIDAGVSERTIGRLAGVSNPRVHQIKNEA